MAESELLMSGTMLFTCNVMFWWVYWHASTVPSKSTQLFRLLCAVLAGISTIIAMLHHDMIATMRQITLTVLWTWLWWNGRPPRKRHDSKLLSVVKVINGKLRIVPLGHSA